MKASLHKTILHKVDIEFSGYDIAELFCNSDEIQQSAFFDYLGILNNLPFQLNAVTNCKELTPSGRAAMSMIGEYANKI